MPAAPIAPRPQSETRRAHRRGAGSASGAGAGSELGAGAGFATVGCCGRGMGAGSAAVGASRVSVAGAGSDAGAVATVGGAMAGVAAAAVSAAATCAVGVAASARWTVAVPLGGHGSPPGVRGSPWRRVPCAAVIGPGSGAATPEVGAGEGGVLEVGPAAGALTAGLGGAVVGERAVGSVGISRAEVSTSGHAGPPGVRGRPRRIRRGVLAATATLSAFRSRRSAAARS